MVILLVSVAIFFLLWSLAMHPLRPESCPVAFDLRRRLPDILRWVFSSLFLALATKIAWQLSVLATPLLFVGFLIVTMAAMNIALRVMWRLLEGRKK